MLTEQSSRSRWRLALWADQANFFEFVIEALIGAHCAPGDTVIDAGASYGAHTYTMLNAVGSAGHVHAFEPNPGIAASLRTWPQQALTVHEVALSDREGVGALRFNDTFSSLNDMSHLHTVLTDQAEVRLAPLDAFGFDRVTFLKIDVDGEEVRLLKGAEKTLMRCRPLAVLEIEWRGLAAGEFFQMLDRFDYRAFSFHGNRITSRSPDDWNMLLIPTEIAPDAMLETAMRAGDDFFANHRGWTPYQKFEQA